MNVDYEKIEKGWFTPKEKTAKEIFEELGYKLWKGHCKYIIVYEKEDRCIRFNLTDTCYLDEKTISIFHPLDEDVYEQEVILSLKELKAINKQVEELWGGNNEDNRL